MLVTHLDSNYLPFGRLYLESAARNAPDEEVYISAANLTPNEMLWLSEFHPKVTIENHKIEVPETIKYRRYMQCRISQVLMEVWERFHGQKKLMIATNVDMLILKPMDELYLLAELNDILLKFDMEHLNLKELLNEVMVIRLDGQYIQPFLKCYNAMWDDGKIVYRDDQRQLYKIFQEWKQLINIGSLPKDYTDKFMLPESHIWSARRWNRWKNYNAFARELGIEEMRYIPNGWGVSL